MFDEIDALVTQYKKDSETTIQEISLRATLSFIPYAGSALNEIKNGLAQRRVRERLNEFLDALKRRLESVDEKKVDHEYFRSEEFQTLLYLLLERLHTSHDKQKLKMFGNALGNAGLTDFKADDKEEFVRVLRDMSLHDLNILKEDSLNRFTPHLSHIRMAYTPDHLSALFRLQAMGLVLTKLDAAQAPEGRLDTPRYSVHAVSGALTAPPGMGFFLSPFGRRFLSFISGAASEA